MVLVSVVLMESDWPRLELLVGAGMASSSTGRGRRDASVASAMMGAWEGPEMMTQGAPSSSSFDPPAEAMEVTAPQEHYCSCKSSEDGFFLQCSDGTKGW